MLNQDLVLIPYGQELSEVGISFSKPMEEKCLIQVLVILESHKVIINFLKDS